MNNRIKAILGIANAKNFLLTVILRGFLLYIALRQALFLIFLYKMREFHFVFYKDEIYYEIFVSIAIFALALYFAVLSPVIRLRKAFKTLAFLKKYGKDFKIAKLKGWLITHTWWVILTSSNFFDRALITKKIEIDRNGEKFIALLSKYSYKDLKLPPFQEAEVKKIIEKYILSQN